MTRFIHTVGLTVVGLWLWHGGLGFAAEPHIALVIGNSGYSIAPPLPNQANDARLMAETLRGLSFGVIESIDADRETILLATFELQDRSISVSSLAAEPGKYGFYMNFSIVGSSISGFDFNDDRVNVIRTADYAAAFAGMVRFGYSHGNMRADLEFGIRTLDEENVSGATDGDGYIYVYTAMINGALDFHPIGDVTPYVAFGVGGALGDGEISYTDGSGNAGRTSLAEITPTGHIGVGGRIALFDAADLTLGYSFLIAPSNTGDQGDHSQAHSLTLGLEYMF